jgi:hypothetical protein
MMMLVREPTHTLIRWERPRARRPSPATSCEACHGFAFGRLCVGCRDKSKPHLEDDPYDIIGGEGGGLA